MRQASSSRPIYLTTRIWCFICQFLTDEFATAGVNLRYPFWLPFHRQQIRETRKLDQFPKCQAISKPPGLKSIETCLLPRTLNQSFKSDFVIGGKNYVDFRVFLEK